MSQTSRSQIKSSPPLNSRKWNTPGIYRNPKFEDVFNSTVMLHTHLDGSFRKLSDLVRMRVSKWSEYVGVIFARVK
jgi:hypothetical protein